MVRLGDIVMYRTVEPWHDKDCCPHNPDQSVRRNYGEGDCSVGTIWRPAIVVRNWGTETSTSPQPLNLRVLADGPGESDSWRTSVDHVSKVEGNCPAWAFPAEAEVKHR